MYRQEGKKKSREETTFNGHCIRTPTRPGPAQRALSMCAMPTSNGDSSPHRNGARKQRNHPSESEDERQRLHCKNAIHLAVPMAKKYYPGDKASSTSTPHVIAMVGLPARGKTYISKKLSRYLNWIGVNTKVFNLGDYRRRMENKYSNHEIFNPENAEGRALREKVCEDGLQDVLDWLEKNEGEVAVFDATNTTRERRKYLYQKVVLEKGFKLFFVESICDDPKIIEANILEVKVTSPDYKHFDKEKVLHDFLERINHYEKLYETIDENLEPDLAYLKIFDTGRKVEIHKHEGHIQSRIVYYLMNVHITPRTIYLTRHGESYNNVIGRLGGDSKLTPRGDEFAKKLGEYVNELKHPNFKVWTSWLRRTIDTAKFIDFDQERWKLLNEIDSGVCDDMTYEDIIKHMPDEYKRRDADKFRYRYPRGESYEDLVARLEPVIMEMERQDSLLIVGHQAVIRCLLAYYMETPEEDLPWLEVPLHTVIKLSPIAYGCKVEYLEFNIPRVSTHRSKPIQGGVLEPKFQRAHRPFMEDLRGIEGLFEELMKEADEAAQSQVKYKELGSTSEYRNGAATNFATKQSEDEKADSNGQNCVKEGANDE